MENLTWLLYLVTRLNAIRDLLDAVTVLSGITCIMTAVVYVMACDIAGPGFKILLAFSGVAALVCAVGLVILALLPTTDQALVLLAVDRALKSSEAALLSVLESGGLR